MPPNVHEGELYLFPVNFWLFSVCFTSGQISHRFISNCILAQALQNLFTMVKCNNKLDKEKVNGTIHVCHRFEHSPKLHMRPAK